MSSTKRFPIRDIQWHEERLREMAMDDDADLEFKHVIISWHSTAIAYLQFGERHQLGGPGAERAKNGKVSVVPVEDYLVRVGSSFRWVEKKG